MSIAAAPPPADPTPVAQATVTATGALRLDHMDGRTVDLHPLWLRERGSDPDAFDRVSHQRLFEPCELPADLSVVAAEIDAHAWLHTAFSDGGRAAVPLTDLTRELGWERDPRRVPAARPWRAAEAPRPTAAWRDLDDPATMQSVLTGFFESGFCVLTDTPREPGNLLTIARRFGFLRETNFGPLFDVTTKPDAIDLAYTGRALSAHADNPYRRPVPGIQMLHCLETTVAGGASTLVDGAALVAALAAEDPDAVEALERVPVRFVYDSAHASLEATAPMIERDAAGGLKCLRFSPRLDYVAPLAPALLTRFYAGRRRLYQMAADPAFQLRFRLAPGMVLMMDNHRLLHGRTGFEESGGFRHLQGCYIDHDGPESLFRMLAAGHPATEVGREVA